MEVEIARYPMRCHMCGATDQVRVIVSDMGGDERYFSEHGELHTARVAPEGWTWERDEDGQPRWVCPACSKRWCVAVD